MADELFGTIGLAFTVVAVVETIILMLIWRYAKSVTWTWLKAALVYRNYAIGIRGTVDRKIRFDNPEIDEQDPHKWSIYFGKHKLPREIKNGHVRRGPDGMDCVLLTDDCTSSLELEEMQKDRIGSTPAYQQQIEDMAYANGYQDGFKKSNPSTLMNDIKENLGSILVIMFMLGLGFYVFHDQIISTPGVMAQVKQCQDRTNLLVAKCSPFVSLEDELRSQSGITQQATTTTIPNQKTGASVK